MSSSDNETLFVDFITNVVVEVHVKMDLKQPENRTGHGPETENEECNTWG